MPSKFLAAKATATKKKIALGAALSPAGDHLTCATMAPICTSDGVSFAASVNSGNAPAGNDYGCLGSVPNPAWFYLRIEKAGQIDTLLSGSNDVDYALWGPYPDVASASATCGSLPAPIGCSYSSSVSETPTIPSTATKGEIYVLLFTNYANSAQQVSFTKTGGVGTTDCGVLSPPPPPPALSPPPPPPPSPPPLCPVGCTMP